MDIHALEKKLQQAVAAFQAGAFGQAVPACEAALAIHSTQPDALHILALSHAQLGHYVAANSVFTVAAKHHPQAHEVLNNHANMLRGQGDLAAALALLEQATKRAPLFAEGWFSRGLTYEQNGNLDEARQNYLEVLKLNPDHVGALTNLGGLLNLLGEYQQALVVLDKALVVRPEQGIALNNKATVLRKLGETDLALETQIAAAKFAPQNLDIMANLARCYQRSGCHEEALSAYQVALQLDPGSVDTQRDYNKLLWERGEAASYLTSVNEALAVLPKAGQVDLLVLKGQLAKAAGSHDVAMSAIKDAMLIGGDSAALCHEMALIYDGAGSVELAREQYQRAIRLAPKDVSCRQAYGEHLLSSHKFDEALALLDMDVEEAFLQKQIALQALALRAVGDDRYQQWYDYDRLTAKLFIEKPEGYASIDSFLEAIEEELEPLFLYQRAPLDQTLFNGVQSVGHLWDTKTPALKKLQQALFDVSCRYITALPDDPTHPFLRAKPPQEMLAQQLSFASAWAVRLGQGGGHVDHIHPDGWASASHYVKVLEEPDSAAQGAGSKAGWLRLGASGVANLNFPAERYFQPEPASVIFFPAYIWHGVEAFSQTATRITTPFDLQLR